MVINGEMIGGVLFQRTLIVMGWCKLNNLLEALVRWVLIRCISPTKWTGRNAFDQRRIRHQRYESAAMGLFNGRRRMRKWEPSDLETDGTLSQCGAGQWDQFLSVGGK